MSKEDHPISPVWMVRAGRHGEDEGVALEESVAIVDFRDFGDLTQYGSAAELATHFHDRHPEAPRRRGEHFARQLWTLVNKIQAGDVVVLPLKTRAGQIAVGRVTGPYRYLDVRGGKRHTRPVEWTHPDLPRSRFRQDLLHSFGAFTTICRIQRNDAERRIRTILAGDPDPGPPANAARSVGPEDEARETELDLQQAASDQVTQFIRAHFPDHGMAVLVESVLRAEGFETQRSTPGPDGGADILAGRGPLGLDPPYLCVQVKATDAPADVKVYRELAGTMAAFKASQGLLVSWGGFKRSVISEARQDTFKIRLWDQSDLVQAIYKSYDKLSPEIQAELPLKRVWMLVREDTEGEE